ncbi:WD40 repeat domain-containing protein [Marinobacter lacisalsi]|uniref:WD40 repeat domain-containing protein n=1 Tax=Marinobacter lacisalsi TaxID=475979 RepID=A0ABV8QEG2_9GAMM
MTQSKNKFSMKSAALALAGGLALTVIAIHYGSGKGPEQLRSENLRIPAQLDGDYITALTYDPGTAQIVTGFESGHAASTDLQGKAAVVHGHEYRVDHVAVSHDSNLLATSASETVIWDRETGESLATLENFHGPAVWGQGAEALFVIERSSVRIYDLTNKRFHSVDARCDGSAMAIALDPTNKVLAAGSSTGRICLWKVLETDDFRGLDLIAESNDASRKNHVKALRFANNGNELLVATASGGIQRFSVPDLALKQAKLPQLTTITNADFLNTESGAVALTGRIRHWDGEEDYFVEVFNLTTGASEILKAKTSTMNHLAWLPDSHQLIVGNVSKYLVLDVPAGFW